MDLGIAGKTALVCASTSGLGKATAQALAAESVRVIVTSRNEQAAVQIAAELPSAVGIGIDLVAEGGAAELYEKAVQAVGEIDILVLNGPGPAPGTAKDTTGEDAAQALDLLVKPQIELINKVLPSMTQRGFGRILSISSTSVQTPIENLALSNLGRAALAGYLKTLAAEVAADGITVNSLLPGRVATPRAEQIDKAAAAKTGQTVQEAHAATAATIPNGDYGKPEDFGAVAAFLCSAQAGYVTGSALRFDGGMVPVL